MLPHQINGQHLPPTGNPSKCHFICLFVRISHYNPNWSSKHTRVPPSTLLLSLHQSFIYSEDDKTRNYGDFITVVRLSSSATAKRRHCRFFLLFKSPPTNHHHHRMIQWWGILACVTQCTPCNRINDIYVFAKELILFPESIIRIPLPEYSELDSLRAFFHSKWSRDSKDPERYHNAALWVFIEIWDPGQIMKPPVFTNYNQSSRMTQDAAMPREMHYLVVPEQWTARKSNVNWNPRFGLIGTGFLSMPSMPWPHRGPHPSVAIIIMDPRGRAGQWNVGQTKEMTIFCHHRKFELANKKQRHEPRPSVPKAGTRTINRERGRGRGGRERWVGTAAVNKLQRMESHTVPRTKEQQTNQVVLLEHQKYSHISNMEGILFANLRLLLLLLLDEARQPSK